MPLLSAAFAVYPWQHGRVWTAQEGWSRERGGTPLSGWGRQMEARR